MFSYTSSVNVERTNGSSKFGMYAAPPHIISLSDGQNKLSAELLKVQEKKGHVHLGKAQVESSM